MVAAGYPQISNLSKRQAPEFTAPNQQRRVEQTGALQVFDKCRDRFVRFAAGIAQRRLEIGMVVPDLPFDIDLDGYPVDSGSPNILWFGDFLGFCNRVNNHLVSRRIHGYRLLDEPIEEFASAFGVAAVETEGELVQV